ncbi:MAG: hypothetical protein QXE01_07755 [Sulfolobales archaeon]
MIRREPIDHDMIIDRDLKIHIVFGSTHPPGRIFTYVKYVPIKDRDAQSIWILMGIPLQRVVERYSVSYVERVFRSYQPSSWDPVYGAEMPTIGYLDIWKHLLPEERGYEIYVRPRDPLEAIASELIDDVKRITGISLGNIGVGGSLLGSFHSVGRSDIDIIVYGCVNASKIYEKAGEIGKPLSGRDLERWVSNISKLHGVPLDVGRAMYSPYRRIIFRGVETTFVFPEEIRRYGEEIAISTGKCVVSKIEVSPQQCSALQYPGRAYIDRVLDAPPEVQRVDEVILFEGTYSPILYRGGVLRISGLLQIIMPGERYRIAVGTRECGGYVLPG